MNSLTYIFMEGFSIDGGNITPYLEILTRFDPLIKFRQKKYLSSQICTRSLSEQLNVAICANTFLQRGGLQDCGMELNY